MPDFIPAGAASQQRLTGGVCGLAELTENYLNILDYFYREYFYWNNSDFTITISAICFSLLFS